MKVWYAADGFDDKDMDNAPWDYGIEWDEVDLYINLGDNKPTSKDKLLMIGSSFDDIITLPKETTESLKEWPIGQLPKDFNHRIIKSALNIK